VGLPRATGWLAERSIRTRLSHQPVSGCAASDCWGSGRIDLSNLFRHRGVFTPPTYPGAGDTCGLSAWLLPEASGRSPAVGTLARIPHQHPRYWHRTEPAGRRPGAKLPARGAEQGARVGGATAGGRATASPPPRSGRDPPPPLEATARISHQHPGSCGPSRPLTDW
jgi:hypothetical protein